MAKLPCYTNQLSKAQWKAIVNPALQSGLRQWIGQYIGNGSTLSEALNAANLNFFGGMATPKMIEGMLPKHLTNGMRRAEFQQRLAAAGNQVAQSQFGSNFFSKVARKVLALPRAEKVLGHFGVFMSSHAGDLAYRPDMWKTYWTGQLRQVGSAASQANTERAISYMERDPLYQTLIDNGLEAKMDITAGGFLGGHLRGASLRAWLGGLTVARFEMAKALMNRWGAPGAIPRFLTTGSFKQLKTPPDLDLLAAQMSEIANHATGSAKGIVQRLGSDVLFGPSLTQSKLSRYTADPIKTVGTFANWKKATYAERAAAWERLWGATQYLGAKYSALQINQGLLDATGSDQKINFGENPFAKDFLQNKGFGLEARIGASDPEIRLLSQIIYASMSKDAQDLAVKTYQNVEKIRTGMSKREVITDSLKSYALSKAQPGIDLGMTLATREDFRGYKIGGEGPKSIPLGEYLTTQLPIIANGPAKFVYDTLTGEGLPASDAMKVVKGLAITGAGFFGAHVTEEKPPNPRAPLKTKSSGLPQPPKLKSKPKRPRQTEATQQSSPQPSVEEIANHVRVTLSLRTSSGKRVARSMKARDAESIFKLEKQSYQELLDSLT